MPVTKEDATACASAWRPVEATITTPRGGIARDAATMVDAHDHSSRAPHLGRRMHHL